MVSSFKLNQNSRELSNFSSSRAPVAFWYIIILSRIPHPQLLNPTIVWQKVKLEGPILREVVNSLPLPDESLGSECWCWAADMADNLMETCQKQGYPICFVADKKGSSSECESSFWLLLLIPTVLELEGNLAHHEGSNLREVQIKQRLVPGKVSVSWGTVVVLLFPKCSKMSPSVGWWNTYQTSAGSNHYLGKKILALCLKWWTQHNTINT